MKYLVLILVCFVLLSCKLETSEFYDENEVLTFSDINYKNSLHLNHVNVAEFVEYPLSRQITPADPKHKKLGEWFRKNVDGWSPTPATYVSSLAVRGKKYSINFHQNKVILNVIGGGQYIKDIDAEDYSFLIEK
ncbi:MAG: hypothetical protein OEZ47_16975 [Gammaproteobacteria bacterium]|nr:hypothetical protein [Gammaproteobacteria bacterium]